MSKELMLHYDCLAKFEEIYFEKLLTQLHITDHEKHIKELSEKGNDNKVLIDDFCTILEKGNKKFMMPSKYIEALPIQIVGVPNKYSLKGEVYHFLEKSNIRSARFKPEKLMSFRELVDTLTAFKHSNQEHYRLLGMINLTQMLDRANFRISTPASFGKDSTVDIMGHLFGDAHTIENPTIAKLEMMTYAKLLAVNEIIDISGSDWRNIEQFLLSTGAFKNKVTKRSRGYGGVGEILDTSKLSLSLMYNDITHYPDKKKYFDEVTKTAVKDRFPPVRLHGRFVQDFNEIANINIDEFVRNNIDQYVAIIRSFYYYKENLLNEMHYYEVPPLSSIPERWKINFGRLFKVMDAYSDDEQEFYKWTNTLLRAVKDYGEMIKYGNHLRLLVDKLKLGKGDDDDNITLSAIKDQLHNRFVITRQEKFKSMFNYLLAVEKEETFIVKNVMLKDFQPNKLLTEVDKW